MEVMEVVAAVATAVGMTTAAVATGTLRFLFANMVEVFDDGTAPAA